MPLRYGVPVTIQATEEILRAEMPHHSWMPDYRYVTEGRQVGYAIRETGEDLVYVRFPLSKKPLPTGGPVEVVVSLSAANQHTNLHAPASAAAAAATTPFVAASGSGGLHPNPANGIETHAAAATSSPSSTPNTPSGSSPSSNCAATVGHQQKVSFIPPFGLLAVSFSVPRRFLVPTRVPASLAPVMEVLAPLRLASPIHQQAAEQRLRGTATAATVSSPNNNNNNNNGGGGSAVPVFAPLGVKLELRPDGRPQLCVVCGQWLPLGEFRSSGFKCNRCIGVPSNSRLKMLYDKMVAEGGVPPSIGNIVVAIPTATAAGSLTATHQQPHLPQQPGEQFSVPARKASIVVQEIAAMAAKRRDGLQSQSSSGENTAKANDLEKAPSSPASSPSPLAVVVK